MHIVTTHLWYLESTYALYNCLTVLVAFWKYMTGRAYQHSVCEPVDKDVSTITSPSALMLQRNDEATHVADRRISSLLRVVDVPYAIQHSSLPLL